MRGPPRVVVRSVPAARSPLAARAWDAWALTQTAPMPALVCFQVESYKKVLDAYKSHYGTSNKTLLK